MEYGGNYLSLGCDNGAVFLKVGQLSLDLLEQVVQ